MHPQILAKRIREEEESFHHHAEKKACKSVERKITVMHSRTKKLPLQGVVVDVTSYADTAYEKFSPFFPHKDEDDGRPLLLQVPCMPPGTPTLSVEGAWQGLKVFEKQGPCFEHFFHIGAKDMKRNASKKRGAIKGHHATGCEERLLDYITARKRIYIQLYNQLLDLPGVQILLEELYEKHLSMDIVLLDCQTNCDIDNPKPLAHAALIKARLHQMFQERTSSAP